MTGSSTSACHAHIVQSKSACKCYPFQLIIAVSLTDQSHCGSALNVTQTSTLDEMHHIRMQEVMGGTTNPGFYACLRELLHELLLHDMHEQLVAAAEC